MWSEHMNMAITASPEKHIFFCNGVRKFNFRFPWCMAKPLPVGAFVTPSARRAANEFHMALTYCTTTMQPEHPSTILPCPAVAEGCRPRGFCESWSWRALVPIFLFFPFFFILVILVMHAENVIQMAIMIVTRP